MYVSVLAWLAFILARQVVCRAIYSTEQVETHLPPQACLRNTYDTIYLRPPRHYSVTTMTEIGKRTAGQRRRLWALCWRQRSHVTCAAATVSRGDSLYTLTDPSWAQPDKIDSATNARHIAYANSVRLVRQVLFDMRKYEIFFTSDIRHNEKVELH
jgi:hypothetical protein